MPEISVMVGPMNETFLRTMLPEGTVIKRGDTKIIWDAAKPEEVETAKASFDKLVAKGYLAFRAEGKEGTKGSQIRKFDPDAERMILIPRMQGGRR